MLLAGLIFLAGPVVLYGAEVEKGFEPIFNGKDLSGWDGNPKLWSVKDGAITGQTTAENPAKGNTFLIWTNGTTRDFELRCLFRLVPGDDKNFANSGIQYRSKVLDPANWVVGGYQADMEAGKEYTGILYEERMQRGIMAARGEKVLWDKDCKKQVTGSVGDAAEIQASIKQRDWNDYLIIAKGNHLQHFVNGRQTVDVTDDCEAQRASSGVLALQLHAGPPMMAQFKNIRIQSLSGGESASNADLQNLQGVWQPTKVDIDGNAVPADDLESVTVTIKGTDYTLVTSDKTSHGKFTLDSSKQPKYMDLQPGSGADDEGRTLLGIYESSADTFRLCYARPGRGRPDSFSAESDSGRVYVSYKRKAQ
jgi:uncharacterized protein (TIGR03067 family)